MKWVGGATAVLSLVGLIYGGVQFLTEARQSRRHVAELVASAKSEADRGEFDLAWHTLADAAAIDDANKLGTAAATIHGAQETVAMSWLEKSRLKEGESWTQFAARLEPILDRGLATAQGQRRADLLAHLGWASFLRSRDGGSARAPEEFYRQALAVDPRNAFANAMLGHWLLWTKPDVAAARPYFDAAAADGRARGFVRTLQLAALRNVHSPDAELETIRVANEMRKEALPLSPSQLRDLWAIYYFFLEDDSGTRATGRLLGAVAPDDHLATFRWLFDKADFSEGETIERQFYLGLLQEAAGQSGDAVATFKSLQTARASPALRKRVDAALKRLSPTSPSNPREVK